jgi:thiamine pyrophosphate-dependent acetolactate synthase large subunit-like protein
VSDAELFVTEYLQHGRDQKAQKPDTSEWLDVVKGLKELPSKYEHEDTKVNDGLLHPWHALKAVFENIPRGSIILIDGGEAGVWALDLLEKAEAAHAMASTGYLGGSLSDKHISQKAALTHQQVISETAGDTAWGQRWRSRIDSLSTSRVTDRPASISRSLIHMLGTTVTCLQ